MRAGSLRGWARSVSCGAVVLGLSSGCDRPAAAPASAKPAATPAAAPAQPSPSSVRVGDACFADAEEPARVWRALRAAPPASPASTPIAVDATGFGAPLRLTLRVLSDATRSPQQTTILLTLAGEGGSSRTLQLRTDAAGCRFEKDVVSVTCFEAGAWVDFALARRGASVHVTKQLGDESEPAPGPRVPYAELRMPSSQPVQVLELLGEVTGPAGDCTASQVRVRDL